MTERGDRMVDRAADKLEQAAEKAAARDPVPDKATEELRGDAAFLRQLKPSLVLARIKGEAPTGSEPGRGPAAPTGPQIRGGGGANDGPNPLAVVGIAFVVGLLLAKIIDWRSHAHPRR